VQTDPRAVAAKFLAGPAAVAVQGIIAFAAEQYVKYKPTVETILRVSALIQEASGDPAGASTSLFGYIVSNLEEEDVKDVVWLFRGGT
jgi:hypothetical protein